jgi:hypothetical protein
MGVKVEDFLAQVDTISAEMPHYEKGHSGFDGLCDCIGLIIGAIRRAGGTWKGTHGSNYSARNEMEYLRPIAGNADLQVGELVYKAHEPGDAGYDAETIERRYATSDDKRDYYHVGVVASVYPLRIRHMTTPLPKTDTSIGKWSWHGWLKKIDHKGEGKMQETVIIQGGNISKPIRMRQAASTGSPIIAEIPQGSQADLLEGGGAWNRVSWEGKTGYVKSEYVVTGGGDEGEDAQPGEMITISRAEIEAVRNLLDGWLRGTVG